MADRTLLQPPDQVVSYLVVGLSSDFTPVKGNPRRLVLKVTTIRQLLA